MALAIIHEHEHGQSVDPRMLAAARTIVAALEQRMQDANATPEEIARLKAKVGRDMATSTSGWEDQVTILRQQAYYRPYTPLADNSGAQLGPVFEPTARPRLAEQPHDPVIGDGSEQVRAAIADAQEAAAEKLADREAHGRNVMNAKLARGESVGGTARSYG
jgi:hypothetical protein